MDLDEEYLTSLYQTERVIKQTDDITVEVVKNTQTGDLEIKKSLSEKYKPLKDIYYALRNVDHKHIVKIIDVFEFETSLVVIEEYIQGRTLAEHLKNPVDKKTAIEWIEQLCDALDFLHSQSPPIIHRDLKPSNIMLQRGQVILIDFNIARTIKHNSTKDTHLIGTSGYASPEQYGFAQTDARSDIYSLGVIFRECLQGSTEKWESIIKKCTAIDPENRYQTAREVLTALKGKNRHTGKMVLIAVLLVASIWGMLRLTTPDIDLNVGGVVEETTISTPAEPSLPPVNVNPETVKDSPLTKKDLLVPPDSIKKETTLPIIQKNQSETKDVTADKEKAVLPPASVDRAKITEKDRKEILDAHEVVYPQFDELLNIDLEVEATLRELKAKKISPEEGFGRLKNLVRRLDSMRDKGMNQHQSAVYRFKLNEVIRPWTMFLNSYSHILANKIINPFFDGEIAEAEAALATEKASHKDKVAELKSKYLRAMEKFDIP